MAQVPPRKMTGLHKAATLLVLMGEKSAVSVLRMLPPKEVRPLTRAIAELGPISKEMADSTMHEYQRAKVDRQRLTKGGSDFAHKILTEAFGETAGGRLLEQAMMTSEAQSDEEGLQRADPQRLARLLEGESPQVVALVVAQLGPKASSAMLEYLPETVRPEIVERVARMRQISPEMVQKISVVLRKRIAESGKQKRFGFAGVNAVAHLLNKMNAATQREILGRIEANGKDLAASIRAMMFTFEDLLDVPEAGLRELLSRADKKTLAVALKGMPEHFVSHIGAAMSARAVEMLREDMEDAGRMLAREVQTARQEIAELARQLEADGKLTRTSEGEDAYVA
jgi:flagellar motor switch protein FliG